MQHILPTYKTTNMVDNRFLIDNYGFRRTEDGATLRFPVYKYKNKPLIFAEFIFDQEEKQIHIRVIDNNGNSCSYNKEEYGDSAVIRKTNSEISKQLKFLERKGIIKC